MTPCDECAAARVCGELRYPLFNSLQCIYCAARLLQAIGTHGLPGSVVSSRRTAALAQSVAAGLDETTIRALFAGPIPLQPPPEKEKKK